MDKAADAISVQGAVNVDVTATDVIDAAGIAVGTTTAVTGTVNVTSTGAAITAATGNGSMDAIAVTGGTTVSVTQKATSDLATVATDTTAQTITQGAVTVTAGNATTTVTVKQDDQVAAVAAVTAAGAAQTQTVTFTALAAKNTVTVNGLTFTAAKNLTAEEVAQAFADLTSGDRQDNGGSVANGTYSLINTVTTYTTGAAVGATVTYTANVDLGGANNNGVGQAALVPAVTQNGGLTLPTAPTAVVSNAGVVNVPAKTGVLGVANGLVTINDNATKSVTDITVDGYSANATLGAGAGGSLDKLTTLTLKNSGTTGTAALTTASTGALTLNLVDVDAAVSLGTTLTNLTINTSGEASTGAISAAGATTVTINAEAALSGGGTFTAATLIDVNGTAKVDLTGATTNAITLATIDASGNTGGVTASLSGINAVKFTGGTGADSLTLNTNGIATGKNIDMGAGNDTLTMLSLTAAGNLAATVTGGAGDADVIALAAANANDTALSSSTAFNGKIDGFEILSLGASVAAAANGDTVNLTNMDGISYVQSANTDVDTKASIVYANADANVVTSDATLSFVSNGVTYTAALTAAVAGVPTNLELQTAVDTAIGVAGQVIATTNGTDITLTALGSDTLVTGAGFVDLTTGANNVTGANTASTLGNVSLRLMNMANNGTLELNASGAGVNVAMLSSTGITDSLNIILDDSKDANGFAAGTVTVTGLAADVAAGNTSSVETVNISVDDTFVDANNNGVDDTNAAFTMTLSEATAKTVNVTGAGDLSLTTAAANLKTVDAEAMTGTLTFTANNASMTVKGGAGADNITITANADGSKFYGNAGNDTFHITDAADLITIDGGAGADTFDFNGVSTNKSNFVVLNNVDSGDTLDLLAIDNNNGATTNISLFNSTKITLSVGATESTQAYLDQAMTVLANGQVGWFQYNGNTYITADVDGESANSFVDGNDFVVMITGTKDLSTASFNTTTDTLEIA